jgi:hypothetical protein
VGDRAIDDAREGQQRAMVDSTPQQAAPSTPPPPSGPDTPEEDAASYGLRRFVNLNANLLRLLSVLFATAAFLRVSPRDETVELLLSLVLATAFVVYWRLWRDLAPLFGILPAGTWTAELSVFYYLFTITVIVAAYFFAAEYLARRDQYLWILLGTALAVAVMVGLTQWARGTHRAISGLASARGFDYAWQARLIGVGLAVLLLVSVPASYYLAHRLSAPFNSWLDAVLPASSPNPSP